MNRRQFLVAAALGLAGSTISRSGLAQVPDSSPSAPLMPKVTAFISRLRYEDISLRTLEAAGHAVDVLLNIV